MGTRAADIGGHENRGKTDLPARKMGAEKGSSASAKIGEEDLSEQRVIATLKDPLVELAQSHQILVLLLLHLSLNGQGLGRRTKGITRTLIHLECPDAEKSDRLRLWVEKSYAKKPSALGVTIQADGNEYDDAPPVKLDPNKGGRPPSEREKAAGFIRNELAGLNGQIGNDLCAAWMKKGGNQDTFWRAVKDMVMTSEITTAGGRGKGKQTTLPLQNAKPQNASRR
ncbi:MAG TPA: hypothetical protein VFF52_14145 [Isosphaeraceae bacterium]|nr:hypothetical protein [Isosphaeraceae bacterium]